ncbi:flagellar assembly protein FliW [Oceanobacillus piezotolerans]|uniref:Flagellar assembly factor FliW n=1 Tax=Oceanobacillus piezotolerans TaxID=2448030 RepID=A0A498D804_9BACI|nr:flagellar assembly protein FliW [Oceanobacillus piezotolerans]RLL46656.1 flagellar assembly protein FliW [Oceanobacillus piezotolerans]
MKLQTKYLAEVEIDDDKIIHFPSGIPGFLEETDFVLLDLPENPAFQILQSINNVNVAFIVTNPYLIYPEYTFNLDDSTIETLKITDEKQVAVFSIVTLKRPFQESTLNLKAPIIVNSNQLIGKQAILNMEEYSSKAAIHPISVEKGVK